MRVFATTPPLFRLQLDGARRQPRPGPGQKADRRLPPWTRPTRSTKEIMATCSAASLHPDQEGKLRRHRKGPQRGRPAEVSFQLLTAWADPRQRLYRRWPTSDLQADPGRAGRPDRPFRRRQDQPARCWAPRWRPLPGRPESRHTTAGRCPLPCAAALARPDPTRRRPSRKAARGHRRAGRQARPMAGVEIAGLPAFTRSMSLGRGRHSTVSTWPTSCSPVATSSPAASCSASASPACSTSSPT